MKQGVKWVLTIWFWAAATTAWAQQHRLPSIADMVHHNPGEPWFGTKFMHPDTLRAWGYNAQIPRIFVECAIDWEKEYPGTFRKRSKERQWVDSLGLLYDSLLNDTKRAGLSIYPFTDFVVLPESLVKKFYKQIAADETTDHKTLEEQLTQGKIKPDLKKPYTQKLVRQMIAGIFDRFPQLDGLTIRTGEIYLQDCPHHTGGNAINSDIENHIILANILRDEVCVKRGKKIFYRTWDFGLLHTNEENFLKLSAAIEPHPNFIFSIKHQKGDYHRFTPFNPTINKGRHPFQVEVQCQLEAYGKGAHPYYTAKGVLEGWEEYKFIQPNSLYQGLKDLAGQKAFQGLWTWTRGGGWKGPYLTNELWPSLNAWVLSHWAQDTTRSEESLFAEFAERQLQLTGRNKELFRKLCLLSAEGVLKGQLTYFHPTLNVWWTRDEFLGGLQQLEKDFEYLVSNGLAEKALAEKREATAIWQQIENISQQLQMPSAETLQFIQTSSTYGRIKYAIIEKGWTVMLKGMQGDKKGVYEREVMRKALADYDALWQEWKVLKATHPDCATLYVDEYFMGGVPGMGASVNHYRNKIGL